MTRIYSVQKSGNLFIVKASIGRHSAAPSIIQLLVDTGATQTGLPRKFLQDIGCLITPQNPNSPHHDWQRHHQPSDCADSLDQLLGRTSG
jgi:hypothetical protein